MSRVFRNQDKQEIVMDYSKLIFVVLIAFVATACENIGKRTVFSALQQNSKLDCELSNNEECPRSPDIYDEYNWKRQQILKEEEKQQ